MLEINHFLCVNFSWELFSCYLQKKFMSKLYKQVRFSFEKVTHFCFLSSLNLLNSMSVFPDFFIYFLLVLLVSVIISFIMGRHLIDRQRRPHSFSHNTQNAVHERMRRRLAYGKRTSFSRGNSKLNKLLLLVSWGYVLAQVHLGFSYIGLYL